MVNTSYRVIGNNQMMAYLVMMAVRLKELHRVPLADRLALSPLRPDRFALFEDFVVKIGEMVYFYSRYKDIISNDS